MKNLCTESGCHAGCCHDTVMRGLNPKQTYPWLKSLQDFEMIGSQAELQEIQNRINRHIPPESNRGKVSALLTSQGLEVYIQGLCPNNSGPPLFNCLADNSIRPQPCGKFPINEFSCALQRTSSG